MAGAYCKYCDNRCFVLRVIPDGPEKGWQGHMATCPRGMAHDYGKTGHTHLTAINPVTNPDAAAAVHTELATGTWTVHFDRVGRNHNVADLVYTSHGADELAEQIYRHARPHLGSRDMEVLVDLYAKAGWISCAMRNGGNFTLTKASAR